jgi:hypothetical protein
MSATANRMMIYADAAGALGKHLARHRIASGQDFAQSGRTGFSCGQQGMPSAAATISDISAADASSIAPAPDDVIIGEVRRPTIARIESKRGMSDQSCTSRLSHIAHYEKRGRCTALAEIADFAATRSCGLVGELLPGLTLCEDYREHVDRFDFGPPW